MVSHRYTSADLELLPDRDDVRYEIIDGELCMSKTPDIGHQYAGGEAFLSLQVWSHATGAGTAYVTPGVIFAEDDDVIPDVVWISRARQALAVDAQGHFRTAPELVIEVLSPGSKNERRDRELKLKLYSRQGVREYWIVDWRLRNVQVYRRADAALHLMATLAGEDMLTSPLLPGYSCPVANLWDPSRPADAASQE